MKHFKMKDPAFLSRYKIYFITILCTSNIHLHLGIHVKKKYNRFLIQRYIFTLTDIKKIKSTNRGPLSNL